jgi:mannosyltransferase OCH1-like enzyme
MHLLGKLRPSSLLTTFRGKILIFLFIFILHESRRRPIRLPTDTLKAAFEAKARVQTKNAYIHETRIPKIIHQTWKTKTISKSNVPPHVRASILNWKNSNPDFEYLLWDDSDMDRMVKTLFPEIYDFYDGLPEIVMKSDVFRLLVLLAFGGIVSEPKKA